MTRRGLKLFAVLLALAGMAQAAQAGYIHAKAALAQVLILRAWEEAGTNGGSPRPWPWADTTPVGRLRASGHGVDLIVLEGGSGRTLAFGPGHVTGTARPGESGNVVVGGHRDTHFRFLKDLRPGDILTLQSPGGERRGYVVSSFSIVDQKRGELQGDFGDDRLTLVTCFPFDALRPGGKERYVVTAIRCDSEDCGNAPRTIS